MFNAGNSGCLLEISIMPLNSSLANGDFLNPKFCIFGIKFSDRLKFGRILPLPLS